MDLFAAHWADKEIRLPPALRCSIDEPIFDRKLMPMRLWRRSPIYNDFLLKIDRPWILSHWLRKSPEKSVLFTIHGSRRRGPLDEKDGEALRPLLPHLRRAMELRQRLEAAQVRIDSLARVWESMSTGITFLDVRGRIIECNGAAEKLMRETAGVRRTRDGLLWLREPAGARLSEWIRSRDCTHERGGLTCLPRPCAQPLSILVTQLPVIDTLFVGAEPRWMLLWFDPQYRSTYATELLEHELGLSPREAEVVALLAEGFNLHGVARQLGITINTARTHLKACLSKTGSHTQVDLLRRVFGGPASWAHRLHTLDIDGLRKPQAYPTRHRPNSS